MIVTIATVKGFQNGIKDKIVKVHGNYIIDHAANMEGADPLVVGAQFVPEFVKNANASELKVMGIERAAISASKAGIIKGDVDIDGVVAKGMGYDDFHYCMNDFLLRQLDSAVIDNEPWVFISKSLSARLQLDTGDRATFVFFVEDSSGRGRPRAARPLIAGIFETGIEQIDNQVVYAELALVQKYLKPKAGFTEIELWESKDSPINLAAISMQTAAGELRISDSRQFHRQIYDWLAILNTNVWVILTLMALVALIAISTILLILMVEKTSFIGIAQAMGSSIGGLQRIFLWQSAYIVGLGLLIGDALAVLLCVIQQQTHFLTLNQDVYFVQYVMVELNPWAIVIVNLGVLLASVMAALIPVQWIKRMTPSRAIRFQ
jgi:lipoprotein-releasing system permease protein